jgi:hypothetical protein
MSEPEYVAIEYAGRVTGVPARTLRRWAEAGKVPVVAGQRKRLVRLDNVRRLAIATGHRPDPREMSGASAGQPSGRVATAVADDNVLPVAGATPEAYLEEVRDRWLQPLINQLKEAERTIGRLEHERDQLREELTAAHATAADAPVTQMQAPVSDVAPAGAPETSQPAWRRLWRRMTGGE